MAKFLNTSGASAQIEEIISTTQNKLVLITPFIKMPEALLERIVDRACSGIKVVIVCREEDLKPDEKNGLKKIRNLELRFEKKLHAKCFYNEKAMVITSLNLYESSSKNREMGILLTSDVDYEIFCQAKEEAEFIIRCAILDVACQSNKSYSNSLNNAAMKSKIDACDNKQPNKSFMEQAVGFIDGLFGNNEGYCIRCGKKLEYNPAKPFCSSCYIDWRRYENPAYKEKHCHCCGKEHRTSMAQPLCRSCQKEKNG